MPACAPGCVNLPLSGVGSAIRRLLLLLRREGNAGRITRSSGGSIARSTPAGTPPWRSQKSLGNKGLR